MDSATQPPLDELLAFAGELADLARPIAMAYFRGPLEIDSKADLSPVTIADRAIEAAMRRQIESRFPGHGILGEEFANRPGDHFTWVLDPIDGTRSFITGMPLFGTLIALLHNGKPVLGVVDFPALSERWTGAAGQATCYQSKTARTSACLRLADARCYSTSPDLFAGEDLQRFNNLSFRASMRRFGGDCYAYALLASGHCDLVVESGLQAYDYLPLVSIIDGAGGKISDWQGRPLTMESDGRVIAAATATLWSESLAHLA